MNAKQRRVALRAANRRIEAYCRGESVRLGIDPEQWGQYTLNMSPIRHDVYITQICCKKN